MADGKHTYWLPIAIAAAFLAVAVFGIVTYVNTLAIRAGEHRIAKSYDIRETTERLLSAIKDMETSQRGYLLTGDAAYLEPYHAGAQQVEAGFSKLRKLIADNSPQAARLNRLQALFEDKRAHQDATIALRGQKPEIQISEEVLKLVRSGRGKVTMDQARQTVREMLDEEATQLAENEKATDLLASISQTTITAGHVIALGLIVFAGVAARLDRKKRDQAETAMLIHQAELAAVIDSAFEGIVVFNDDLTIRRINPAAAQMHCLSSDTALGRSMLELIPSRFHGRVIREVREFTASGKTEQPFSVDLGLRSDGSEFPCEGTLTRAATERDHFNTLTLRDLSEAKANQAKQREYTAILGQIRDAIMVCDMNDQILSWNEGAAAMFSIAASEAIGKNAHSLLFADRPDVWELGKQVVLEAGKFTAEIAQITPDGREIIIEQRRSLIRDEHGARPRN